MKIEYFTHGVHGMRDYAAKQLSSCYSAENRENVELVIGNLEKLRSNGFKFHNWKSALRAVGFVRDACVGHSEASIQRIATVIALYTDAVYVPKDSKVCVDEPPYTSPSAALFNAHENDSVNEIVSCTVTGGVSINEFACDLPLSGISQIHEALKFEHGKHHADVAIDAIKLARDANLWWLASPYSDFIQWCKLYQSDKGEIYTPKGAMNTMLAKHYENSRTGNVYISQYATKYEAAAKENLLQYATDFAWADI